MIFWALVVTTRETDAEILTTNIHFMNLMGPCLEARWSPECQSFWRRARERRSEDSRSYKPGWIFRCGPSDSSACGFEETGCDSVSTGWSFLLFLGGMEAGAPRLLLLACFCFCSGGVDPGDWAWAGGVKLRLARPKPALIDWCRSWAWARRSSTKRSDSCLSWVRNLPTAKPEVKDALVPMGSI